MEPRKYNQSVDTEFERRAAADQMPRSEWAEQLVLGSLLFDPHCISRCEGLEAKHFYDPMRGLIWQAALDLYLLGMEPTPPAIEQQFAGRQSPSPEYLGDLLDCAATPVEIPDAVKIIRDTAQRRELIHLADVLRRKAIGDGSGYVEPGIVLADAEGELLKMSRDCGGADKWQGAPDIAVTLLESVREAVEFGRPRGLATGILRLDQFMGGMRAGDLIIIAGASSMGKTSFARNIAYSVAKAGGKVAFFSQEMTAEQLGMRCLAAEARRAGTANVPYRDLDTATISARDLDALYDVELASSIIVDDTASLTPLEVRLRAQTAAKRLGGLDLIVVDYLQIMDLPQDRGENFARTVGRATNALKRMAKDFGCPVIVLSQLSRMKGQEDKRPQLHDLRESGAIEQDADKVMFVYREAYYVERKEPAITDAEAHYEWQKTCRSLKSKVEIIIGKNRMGRIGTVELWIDQPTDLILSSEGELRAAEIIPIHGGRQ